MLLASKKAASPPTVECGCICPHSRIKHLFASARQTPSRILKQMATLSGQANPPKCHVPEMMMINLAKRNTTPKMRRGLQLSSTAPTPPDGMSIIGAITALRGNVPMYCIAFRFRSKIGESGGIDSNILSTSRFTTLDNRHSAEQSMTQLGHIMGYATRSLRVPWTRTALFRSHDHPADSVLVVEDTCSCRTGRGGCVCVCVCVWGGGGIRRP